jgi:4-hydroxy-4-methyl-2-oxoglutarate aldolase
MATEDELAKVRSKLFGLISEDRITAVDIERPPPDTLSELGRITDLTSSVSDVLDELGVGGGVPGSTLRPLSAGRRLIGPAITIRSVPQGGSAGSLSARGERARLADRDLYNVGRAGDVAVFDCGGFTGASVMGGLSAAWASRIGIAGCVIDGSARDVAAVRDSGVPVWARGVTPVSGKHRLEAIEINGVVGLAGLTVRPGDVIVADDTGVCVIPAEHVDAVTRAALDAEVAERTLTDAIAAGATPEEVAAILRPEKW